MIKNKLLDFTSIKKVKNIAFFFLPFFVWLGVAWFYIGNFTFYLHMLHIPILLPLLILLITWKIYIIFKLSFYLNRGSSYIVNKVVKPIGVIFLILAIILVFDVAVFDGIFLEYLGLSGLYLNYYLIFAVVINLPVFTLLNINRQDNLFVGCVVGLLLFFYVNQFNNLFLTDFKNSINNYSSGYEKKMLIRWGDFYKYIQFVKNNTLIGAKINNPPFGEANLWEGNTAIMRSLLYPREVVSYAEFQGDSILLVGPKTDAPIGSHASIGWPNFEIKNVKAIYIYGVGRLNTNNYDPDDPYYTDKKGVIII